MCRAPNPTSGKTAALKHFSERNRAWRGSTTGTGRARRRPLERPTVGLGLAETGAPPSM